MTTKTHDIPDAAPLLAARAPSDVPFGVNEMRLTRRQWLAVAAILAACVFGIPRIWERIERFDPSPDYRIPYSLSSDYWLYQRRLEKILDPASIPVVGDSVVWGEYVRPDGTLTHFLNRESGQPDRFVNCGVNGLFPLAMEGLLEHYGVVLRDRKVIVHCNLLWMTSPRADLSTTKEEAFNHAQLVPQFFPRLACYRADTADRLSAVIDRNVALFGWVAHVRDAYFNQQSIPRWTLEDNGGSPPTYPNAWKDPLRQVTLSVPDDPPDDSQRGPTSVRHKPWSDAGTGPSEFDWVELDASRQWRAMRNVILGLCDRGNDVLVIVGPFNEHMVAEGQRPTCAKLRDGVAAWLTANRVAHVVPPTLPSQLYADASHPLTEGYALLARRLFENATVQQWLAAGRARQGPASP